MFANALRIMVQACVEWEPVGSDAALVARAKHGERTAFVEIMKRFQERIYRLAFRMCRNTADAEEVTQDTFVQAYRGISSFQGESRLSTWLFRIAINQVLMRRRAGSRRPVVFLEALAPSDSASLRSSSDRGMSTDDLLHEKRVSQRVLAALGQLDDAHRAVLVLRDLEELSAEDVGEILGISPTAVRQRAHRARLRLREQLADLASHA